MKRYGSLTRIMFTAMCLVAMVFLWFPHQAQANTELYENDNCTTFQGRMQEMQDHSLDKNGAILSDIYRFIKTATTDATYKLFIAFTSSPNYQQAVFAAMSLMITFYGVAFIIGIAQPSFQQVLVRLFKLFILGTLISPGGWRFFDEHVVEFFQEGSDDLIIRIQAIGFGGTPPPAGATPFWALDNVANFIIQPDTIIALMGAFGASGPYGLTMGALMFIAFKQFVQLILKVLTTYCICYVARAMILGVAPIFFVFLLFDKTKQMFVAWVNTLLNLSLRPILLFTFMSFFLVLIESATANMLNTELCWGDFKNIEGSMNKMAFWRFKDPVTDTIVSGDYTFEGAIECLISPNRAADEKCQEFPIDIMGLLSFLILMFIASRFVDLVDSMASELSTTFVALDSSGRMEQFMQAQNQTKSKTDLNPSQGGVKT